MLWLIDNYDSFVHNLGRYLVRLGMEVAVVRNDDPRLVELDLADCHALVLSPGPGRPEHAGRCMDLVRTFSGRVPILGVCLGHQAICATFGGTIVRARRPLHGKASAVSWCPSPLFEGLPNPAEFGRYHSLVADPLTLPGCLQAIAHSPEGEIMAVQHLQHPTYGVQFHPESILSPWGMRLLENFLGVARTGTAQTGLRDRRSMTSASSPGAIARPSSP